MVAARAEYIIQENIINIVPSFHNYQDIRTFFSVATRQTFRYRHWPTHVLSASLLILAAAV